MRGSSDAAKEGAQSFFFVLGLISLSIALLNLLPLLPLDGGHIVFAIAEGIRGRAVRREIYERVSVVGIGARRAAVLRRPDERHRPALLRAPRRTRPAAAGALEPPPVLAARDLDRAERREVRRQPLHVEEPPLRRRRRRASSSTSPTNAAFEASVRAWNIDSAAKSPPIATP